MLTKNGKVLFAFGAEVDVSLIDEEGNSVVTQNSNIYLNSSVACLGTGTNPPSEDDVSMDHDIFFQDVQFSTLDFPAFTEGPVTSNFVDSKGIYNMYVNSAFVDETITFTEIGILAGFNDDDGDFHSALIARELLKTPITLEAGKLYNLTFKMSI